MSKKRSQWAIFSIQDAFKFRLNISDIFKAVFQDLFQYKSKNPGDRSRRHNSQVNSNNNNTSSADGQRQRSDDGSFLHTRLTPQEIADLRADMSKSEASYAGKLLQMAGGTDGKG